jgi:3-dehydroquinate synthase
MFLTTGNCPIYFEKKGFEYLKNFLLEMGVDRQIFVITDENCLRDCWPLLEPVFNPDRVPMVIPLRAGERHKNLESTALIWETLLGAEAKRNSLIVNLGGGVITDMGGFAASVFKRGIPYIHIPTSLLGMVDASIGGKTGIDFKSQKNMLGTFSYPEAVCVWDGFLETLPQCHQKSGMAEAYKHALIDNSGYWEFLKRGELSFERIIFKSLEIKKKLADKDPKEKGERKKLNFGHTIAHSLEAYFLEKETEILHGDAVAAGIIVESYLSWKSGFLSLECLEEIKGVICQRFSPVVFPLQDVELLLDYMKHDKKNDKSGLNFTLLDCVGGAIINQRLDASLVSDGFAYYAALK